MNDQAKKTTSRRALLKAGGAGALTTAFLVACADDKPAGVSGSPAPATSVPPTVPPKEPTKAQLLQAQVELRTLASVELAVAAAYDDQVSKIGDTTLVSRFAAVHRDAAAALIQLTDSRETVEANKVLQETVVAPAAAEIVDESGARHLLSSLESTLTATYIKAVQNMVDPSKREDLMSFGAAAARRSTFLSDGAIPTEALFPSTDLISNNAYLTEEKAAE